MPVQETRLGLPWDARWFLGQSGAPCVPGAGREGGKPCLVPSRVGMAEVTKY